MAEGFDSDEIVEMDAPVDKTGEHKKRAIFTIAGTAMGAFLGDIFIGRYDEIAYQSMTERQAADIGISDYYRTEWVGMDRGGVIEDISDKLTPTQIDQNGDYASNDLLYNDKYENVIHTRSESSMGDGEPNIYETRFGTIKEESQVNILKESGYLDAIGAQETIRPDGALIGGGVGGSGTYALDKLRNRLKKRKQEEKKPSP